MRKVVPILIAVIVIAAAGAIFYSRDHSAKGATTTTTTSTTTTTVPKGPFAPLTGLLDPTGVSLTRPALTVKIENTPEALPQWGITEADVVYEEIVNGGITRLAAVFNSHAPTKIGPVRSVRPTDTQVVWPIGGIFAFSGGAPYAIDSIETAPVKLIDEDSAGTAMFRDLSLRSPAQPVRERSAALRLQGHADATARPL